MDELHAHIHTYMYTHKYVHSHIGMTLEGVTKRTEHHGYNIGIYLQEQRMVTRT